jgi:hypothetical protein
MGKLLVVPVGDTGTIQHPLRNVFSGAPGDRRPDTGDGCKMWSVPSVGPCCTLLAIIGIILYNYSIMQIMKNNGMIIQKNVSRKIMQLIEGKQ